MTQATEVNQLSFEDALRRLEAIVARLETGDVALEESISLYAEGDALHQQCEARLKAAQARIEKITQAPDGQASGTVPFDAA